MVESKLFVVVRGNKVQAERAAANWGIPFVYVSELGNHTETTGHVGASFATYVQDWYAASRARDARSIGDLIQWEPLDLPVPAGRPGVTAVPVETMHPLEAAHACAHAVEPQVVQAEQQQDEPTTPEDTQDPYDLQCDFRNEASYLPSWA